MPRRGWVLAVGAIVAGLLLFQGFWPTAEDRREAELLELPDVSRMAPNTPTRPPTPPSSPSLERSPSGYSVDVRPTGRTGPWRSVSMSTALARNGSNPRVTTWNATHLNTTFTLTVDETLVCAALRGGPGAAVVTFSSWRHQAVLLNWLVWLNSAGVAPGLIFALDRALFDFLSDRGIPSLLVPVPDLTAIWVVRVAIFQVLLECHRPFVHSDTDALWLRDPRPALAALGHSLVFSQGTIAPLPLVQQWGFVLCQGFFYADPSPFAVRFFARMLTELLGIERWRKKLAGDAGDQDALNWAVKGLHVRWQLPPPIGAAIVEMVTDPYLTAMATRINFTFFGDAVVGRFQPRGPTFAMAPHSLIMRTPADAGHPAPAVLHLNFGPSKMADLEVRGLWALRFDWSTVPFANDASAWLSALRRADPPPCWREFCARPFNRPLEAGELETAVDWTPALFEAQRALLLQGGGGTIEKRQWLRYLLNRLEAPPASPSDDELFRRMQRLEGCRAIPGAPWTRSALLAALIEFLPLYRAEARAPAHPQMWLLNTFVVWFTARRLQPRYVVLSGLRAAATLRLLRHAVPAARIFVAPPQLAAERVANVTYIVRRENAPATRALAAAGGFQVLEGQGFTAVDWATLLDPAQALVVCHDGVPTATRLADLRSRGFRRAILMDNMFPLLGRRGPSVKQACDESAGAVLLPPGFNMSHWLWRNYTIADHRRHRETVLHTLKVYAEFPPILFAPGHLLTHRNARFPNPSDRLLRFMVQAFVPTPLVQTQTMFERLQLSMLNLREFWNYNHMAYVEV